MAASMKARSKFSHLDKRGRAKMVDVSAKADTKRVAVAQGKIIMKPETLKLILQGGLEKGDVFTVAKVAAIQAAKRTSELVPLCHPLPIDGIEIKFVHDKKEASITAKTTVTSTGKTGVEMEALTACAIALLSIYDMAKSAERGMEIKEIYLLEKRGGKSGSWVKVKA